jgi:halocarboxylic acid dehydrogenase DehI
LKVAWNDLAPVVRSKEFHAAGLALEEYIYSVVVAGGWRFNEQRRELQDQRFSTEDTIFIADALAIFAHGLPQMLLLARLLQAGYSGGQHGRISHVKQTSMIAQALKIHVPNERESGLRSWLIYNDIKKTTGSRSVLSVLRFISPYPGYLASVWIDWKKTLKNPAIVRAKEEVSRRSAGLATGLPVGDHRASGKIRPEHWREIEETVDGFVRMLPLFALVTAVWRKSFMPRPRDVRAA